MSDLTLAQIPLVTHLLWDLGPLLRQPVPLFPIHKWEYQHHEIVVKIEIK